jgi:hypothetical protein
MCLNGIGTLGSDNKIQVDWDDIAHQWMLDSVKNKYKPFVFYPQCPSPSGTYEWGYFNTGTAAQKGYAALATQAAVKVIDSLIKVYPIDTTRLYVVGLSWGGIGTEACLMSYPNKFAAMGPCAGENYLNTVSVMTKTPFWMWHGAVDQTVPVAPDRNLVAACSTAHYPVVKYYAAINTTTYQLLTPTGISADSLLKAVVNGAKFLYNEVSSVTGCTSTNNHDCSGYHWSGWYACWFHPLFVPWLMAWSKVNAVSTFTWPAPGPKAVTAVSQGPLASPASVSGPLQIAGGTIRWKGVSRLPFRLDIYAANGSLVKRYEICQGEGALDCSGLTKGVYFVTIDAQNRSARMMAISENRR